MGTDEASSPSAMREIFSAVSSASGKGWGRESAEKRERWEALPSHGEERILGFSD